ncbi:efflux RND transporter periplasmic adaptor subunit [Spirosoma aerolatum]|uniref:efflux RND transporter periplasmic adaptor subunit n=1 Tax=Spirosoma aerolatum TaxID=1211326 RepID=UPI0009AC9B91|nr:efflux RND transporter periplasmic adaptor subunit [Spirosoma aerolatum]
MKSSKPYVALMTLFVLSGCQTKEKTTDVKEVAIPVITEQVTKQPINRTTSISGNIEGSRTVRLGFMVAGKLNFIAADEGQPVRKGQLLASLDPTNYGIAKELSDVQVAQVGDEYNRLKIMHDRNSLSDADFAKVNFGLQQAKVQQKLQTKNLSDTKLYAPISGVMLKKMAEVGEITGVGTPLFVVSDISKVNVNAYIPESELHTIKIGQSARVLVSSVGQTFTGKVKEVGSVADVTSRAFTVKIELPNPNGLIRPGMIAEITLASNQPVDRLLLPAEAILHDTDNQSYVYVVDKGQQKAFRRNVSVGQLVKNKIEVTAGLSPQEIVVTGGQQKLTDGSSVSLSN